MYFCCCSVYLFTGNTLFGSRCLAILRMRNQFHKPPLSLQIGTLSFESCLLFVFNRERGTTSPGAERFFCFCLLFVFVFFVVLFSVNEYHKVPNDKCSARYGTQKLTTLNLKKVHSLNCNNHTSNKQRRLVYTRTTSNRYLPARVNPYNGTTSWYAQVTS